MNRTYRRRLIAGKIPNRFSLTNLNFFLFLFLIFGAALFGPLMIGMEFEAFPYFFGSEELASQYLLFQKLIWPPVVLLFVILCVGTVVFTHRIAGPLYRLRNVLKTIAEGNLSVQASIRKYDYLQEEADCINEMIASLRAKIVDIETQHRAVEGALLEVTKSATSGSDMARQLQRLETEIDQLGARLRLFKTAP